MTGFEESLGFLSSPSPSPPPPPHSSSSAASRRNTGANKDHHHQNSPPSSSTKKKSTGKTTSKDRSAKISGLDSSSELSELTEDEQDRDVVARSGAAAVASASASSTSKTASHRTHSHSRSLSASGSTVRSPRLASTSAASVGGFVHHNTRKKRSGMVPTGMWEWYKDKKVVSNDPDDTSNGNDNPNGSLEPPTPTTPTFGTGPDQLHPHAVGSNNRDPESSNDKPGEVDPAKSETGVEGDAKSGKEDEAETIHAPPTAFDRAMDLLNRNPKLTLEELAAPYLDGDEDDEVPRAPSYDPSHESEASTEYYFSEEGEETFISDPEDEKEPPLDAQDKVDDPQGGPVDQPIDTKDSQAPESTLGLSSRSPRPFDSTADTRADSVAVEAEAIGLVVGKEFSRTPTPTPSPSPEPETKRTGKVKEEILANDDKDILEQEADAEVEGDADPDDNADADVIGQTDVDVEVETGETELEMQPAHRAEALDVLAGIELKFAFLRERLYVEKMQDLAFEESMIVQGIHPEMIHLQNELQARHDRRLDLALKKRNYEQASVMSRRKTGELAVWSWWKFERDELQTEMFVESNRKRRKIERERRNLERPLPTRRIPAPLPLRSHPEPISIREIVKSSPYDSFSRSKKRKQHDAPTNPGSHLIHPELSVLSPQEISHDLHILHGRRNLYSSMQDVGPGVGAPMDVYMDHQPMEGNQYVIGHGHGHPGMQQGPPPLGGLSGSGGGPSQGFPSQVPRSVHAHRHHSHHAAVPGSGHGNASPQRPSHALSVGPSSTSQPQQGQHQHARAVPPHGMHQNGPMPPGGGERGPSSLSASTTPLGLGPYNGPTNHGRRSASPAHGHRHGHSNLGNANGMGHPPPLSSSLPQSQPLANGERGPWLKQGWIKEGRTIKDSGPYEMRERDRNEREMREREMGWGYEREKMGDDPQQHRGQVGPPLQQSQQPHRHTLQHQSLQGIPHHHHLVHHHHPTSLGVHHHHSPSSSRGQQPIAPRRHEHMEHELPPNSNGRRNGPGSSTSTLEPLTLHHSKPSSAYWKDDDLDYREARDRDSRRGILPHPSSHHNSGAGQPNMSGPSSHDRPLDRPQVTPFVMTPSQAMQVNYPGDRRREPPHPWGDEHHRRPSPQITEGPGSHPPNQGRHHLGNHLPPHPHLSSHSQGRQGGSSHGGSPRRVPNSSTTPGTPTYSNNSQSLSPSRSSHAQQQGHVSASPHPHPPSLKSRPITPLPVKPHSQSGYPYGPHGGQPPPPSGHRPEGSLGHPGSGRGDPYGMNGHSPGSSMLFPQTLPPPHLANVNSDSPHLPPKISVVQLGNGS